MGKKTIRPARDLKNELADKHNVSITYKELGDVLGYQVKAITSIEGATSTILKKINQHRGGGSEPAARPAPASASADSAAPTSSNLIGALLEGGSIEAVGVPVLEVAVELSQRLGREVSSNQVLDALGFFGTEDTHTDVPIDEIERRVEEQNQLALDGTFGGVLSFYRGKGHIGLMPSATKQMLRGRVEGIEGWEGGTVLTDDQQVALSAWLNETLKICVQMSRDVKLPPAGQDRVCINPDAPIERRIYKFTARCHHETTQWLSDALGNLDNPNLSVGTWKQLCDECAEVRARLLMKPPDAAKEGQMTCPVCSSDVFETGLKGLVLSRGHLWQNGMRNVFSINMLLDRLLPRHRRDNKRCATERIKRLETEQASKKRLVEECDSDIAEEQINVLTLVDEHPHLKEGLKLALPENIKKIRANHGFPTTDAAYNRLRREVGLVGAPAARTASKKSTSARRPARSRGASKS